MFEQIQEYKMKCKIGYFFSPDVLHEWKIYEKTNLELFVIQVRYSVSSSESFLDWNFNNSHSLFVEALISEKNLKSYTWKTYEKMG